LRSPPAQTKATLFERCSMGSSSSAPAPTGGIPTGPPGDRLPPEDVLRLRVKAEIRKRLRALRKTTPLAACADRSQRIVRALEGMAPLREARKVALFWPIEEKHEVDLRPLDASLRGRGVRVAYPTILESGEMIFRTVSSLDELSPHALGFQAPPEGEPERDVDLVVVPAIALDPAGYRIGYGGGFYDRALPSLHATRVGVAYEFQLIPEVPRTPRDVPVDWIVTDHRVLQASPDG
jgi:5-formyltetrahydrofolate cyclo-ligase